MVGRISRRAMAASRDAGSSSDVLPKDKRVGRSRDSDLRVDRLGREEGHGRDGGAQARPTVADPLAEYEAAYGDEAQIRRCRLRRTHMDRFRRFH